MQNLLKSKTLIKLRTSDTVESLGGRLCNRKVVNSECGVEDCHSPEHLILYQHRHQHSWLYPILNLYLA